ncbi:DUF418 domain-containing protein [Spongiactinospora sp. TRM90649]|uniref:DUF418 domain-containing protein n=1 Tax=Spongiactinospora sp. TRM90649 TaxID=3031114 RepID=UPI0023F942F7|nr:DUF418 domain-containing protein [Spongiactinospora sp. TRM90649]MDF5752397.1 DUF418 domain-containing protein [Spongiactinospora sp. TRM90649]
MITPHRRAARIDELDAVRGFALCGIMVVNAWQHTRQAVSDQAKVPYDVVVENLLQSRFFPIFSFLFGVSLVLFLRSAGGDRVVLLRRLAVLALIGFAHTMVNPGEVLLPYALFGLAVLVPASFLPRLAVLLLGVGATGWAVWMGGGVVLVPGLFLLGMAFMEYRPPSGLVLPVFLVSAPLGAVLTWLWVITSADGDTFVAGLYPLSGLISALAYCTGLLLLLRTPLRRPLTWALNPIGRMALTNYVAGTPVILLTLPLLTADQTHLAGLGLGAVTIAVQIAFSRWWLARFRYGPLEWVWRCLTWGELVRNRLDG